MTEHGPSFEEPVANGPAPHDVPRPQRPTVRPNLRLVAALITIVLVAMVGAWATVWLMSADAIPRSRDLVSQGKPSAAEAELQFALRARPGNRGLLLELARVGASTGDVEGAMEMYRNALRSGPDASISYELAMVERLAGRTTDAERDFAVAAAGNPGDATYADEHAKTLLELGRSAEALAVWRRIAGDTNRSVQVRSDMRLRVARVLFDAGDRAGARSEALAALALAPGDPQATAMVGQTR